MSSDNFELVATVADLPARQVTAEDWRQRQIHSASLVVAIQEAHKKFGRVTDQNRELVSAWTKNRHLELIRGGR